MSEIKNVGLILMAKCNQLTSLPFKGLKTEIKVQSINSFWKCC